jgi:hypothetical protein
MEGIIILLIVMSALKTAGQELPFTLRGKIPPSHERRMEKLRQKGARTGTPVPATRTGRYFAGLADEAINRSHQRAAARTKVKTAVAHTKAEHKAALAVDKLTGRWDRKAAKKAARRSGQDGPDTQPGPDRTDLSSTAGTDARPAGTPIIVPAGTARPAVDQADVDPEPGEPVDAVTEPEGQPESTEVAAPEQNIGEEASQVAAGTPVSSSTDRLAAFGAETTSLRQALDYASLLADQMWMLMDSVQSFAEGLRAHGVEGATIEELGQTYSALEAAVACLGDAHAALEKQNEIKEVYTDDAGSEEFIKGHLRSA